MKMAGDDAKDAIHEKAEEVRRMVGEKLLPTKEFNESLRGHVAMARENIEDRKTKNFMPRLVLDVINEKGRSIVVIGIPDLPGDSGAKREAFSKIGIAAVANGLNVLSVTFLSEAWMATEKPGADLKMAVPPSERPDRQEAIIVISQSIDGKQGFASIPITGRDADEVLILGEETVHEHAEGKKVDDRSLVSEFLQSYSLALLTRLTVEEMVAQGREDEIPEEARKLILLLDECPIKLTE